MQFDQTNKNDGDVNNTLCGKPIVLTARTLTIGVSGPVTLGTGSAEEWFGSIRTALMRDQAELLDAQMMGDKEREAKAQTKMDAWNKWAASLPDDEGDDAS